MPILETLIQIPPFLYLAALFFPAFLFAYFSAAKPKKTVAAKDANPADQLKERRVDVPREIKSALFLGLTIACGLAMLVFCGQIVADYKASRGLFAPAMPAAAFPPAPNNVFPPPPNF